MDRKEAEERVKELKPRYPHISEEILKNVVMDGNVMKMAEGWMIVFKSRFENDSYNIYYIPLPTKTKVICEMIETSIPMSETVGMKLEGVYYTGQLRKVDIARTIKVTLA